MPLPAPHVLRYAAFTDSPQGGNPAGVVLDASGLDDPTMARIAADVGYSETAFVTARDPGPRGRLGVRYFSPRAEVPFCGHATIATGVALGHAEGPGEFALVTHAGPVRVTVTAVTDSPVGDRAPLRGGVDLTATFESPPAGAGPLPEDDLEQLLAALGWARPELDPRYPPMVATAGNRHPVLVAADLPRLADLHYDVDALALLCAQHDWTTIQLVVPLTTRRWRSRNPFPAGGVFEDPATGAAAAALGGYLRELGAAQVGDRLLVEQGVEMGRPSRIHIEVGASMVLVTGRAAPIPG